MIIKLDDETRVPVFLAAIGAALSLLSLLLPWVTVDFAKLVHALEASPEMQRMAGTIGMKQETWNQQVQTAMHAAQVQYHGGIPGWRVMRLRSLVVLLLAAAATLRALSVYTTEGDPMRGGREMLGAGIVLLFRPAWILITLGARSDTAFDTSGVFHGAYGIWLSILGALMVLGSSVMIAKAPRPASAETFLPDAPVGGTGPSVPVPGGPKPWVPGVPAHLAGGPAVATAGAATGAQPAMAAAPRAYVPPGPPQAQPAAPVGGAPGSPQAFVPPGPPQVPSPYAAPAPGAPAPYGGPMHAAPAPGAPTPYGGPMHAAPAPGAPTPYGGPMHAAPAPGAPSPYGGPVHAAPAPGAPSPYGGPAPAPGMPPAGGPYAAPMQAPGPVPGHGGPGPGPAIAAARPGGSVAPPGMG